MKKKSFILVVFLLLIGMFFLAACQGEVGIAGEKGPQGDKGAQGEVGPQGDKGATGKKGATGDDGDDATQITLGTTSEGIVWKNEGEESWKPVISFDDLFAYRNTYTITLNPKGGTLDESKITGCIYKEDVLVDQEPTLDPWSFAGWYFDEEYKEKAPEFITVTDNVTLYAKWTAEIILEGVEGAEGKPLFEYLDAEGQEKSVETIMADVKEAFINDYCEAKGYNSEETAAVQAMTQDELYTEFYSKGLVDFGGLLIKNDYTTTELADKWAWVLPWVFGHYNIHSTADETILPRDGYYDARNTYIKGLLAGNGMGGAYDAAYAEGNEKANTTYVKDCFATTLCNFLFMSAKKTAICSKDKTVSFLRGGKKYDLSQNETGDYDPYEGFVDMLKVVLEPTIELNYGETYDLINLKKDGYVFQGWVDDKGNAVTTVTADYNGQIITAVWKAEAN